MGHGDTMLTESTEAQIARIDERTEDMYTRLFGNGQKGIVQIHDEAISSLNGWRNRVVGALSVIIFILGIIGTKLVGWW